MATPGFFASILHPDDREPVLEEVRLSRAELRPFSRDYRLIARSGETVWVQDESVPVLDARGRPEFIQGYFVDLTERKALEQQLLQSQKTEALGRMAAGIAHDFNNHLTAIRGHADLLRLELPAHSKAQHDVTDIVDTTVRAKMLIEQLLGLLPQGTPRAARNRSQPGRRRAQVDAHARRRPKDRAPLRARRHSARPCRSGSARAGHRQPRHQCTRRDDRRRDRHDRHWGRHGCRRAARASGSASIRAATPF